MCFPVFVRHGAAEGIPPDLAKTLSQERVGESALAFQPLPDERPSGDSGDRPEIEKTSRLFDIHRQGEEGSCDVFS
ncbi:MAG: hypothetical protein ACP5OP_05935 [Leptospirillia bacterium]